MHDLDPYSPKAMMRSSLLLLIAAAAQVGAFAPSSMPASALALRSAKSVGAVSRPGGFAALRMAEGEGKEDPYAVKEEKPSFAKEENQWELDNLAGEESGDSKKKMIAITTGAFAMVISVAYLLAVVALESRGEMKPAPEEAYGAFNFVQAAAVSMGLFL
mmetsp:Transcript_2070/g.4800  ORF Transcript_2070/g.4800 Transcript_2070/m.4800 type:complete len:160 (-) Transcript_2070:75-554(-)